MPRSTLARVWFAATMLALSAADTDGALAQSSGKPTDSTWREHELASRAAADRGDWATAKAQYLVLDSLLRGHGAVVLGLARTEARLGDTAAAFRRLRTYAAMGLGRDVENDSAFVAMRGTSSWMQLREQLRANRMPLGIHRTAMVLPDSDFLPEEIVWERGRRRFFLSGMRDGRIIAVTRSGQSTEFARVPNSMAVLGLAVDERRDWLWASIEAMPQNRTYSAAEAGKSAIVRFDLGSGNLVKRYDLPVEPGGHEPGDITLTPDGDLVVGDGRAGMVWVIRRQRDSLEVLVKPGTLISPQGSVVRNGTLIVADYTLGLAAVNLTTGRVSLIEHGRDAAVSGIDGLALAADGLIAVQNGVTPNRLVAISLTGDSRRVVSVKTVLRDTSLLTAPNHAAVIGDSVFAIANSGWNAFAVDGTRRRGVTLAPARIVVFSLRKATMPRESGGRP